MNYTDLLSTPDTTNNREPVFPGFPNFGNQHSDRYTVQTNLRSTLTGNLVNEFKIGGSGGATRFSPEIGPAQFGGTAIADQGGFFLDINDVGISSAASTGSYSAREATTRILENTLSWLKGSHNVQAGFAFTQADVWIENQQHVPTIGFGINSDDPVDSLFRTANFPGASSAQLSDARELYAMLTGRVDSISGQLRLDENTDEYRYLGLGVQRARLRDYGFFVSDTWRWKPNLTLNLGLRYELQVPFTPLNNSYSKATIADVCGVSGVAPNGACNIFSPGEVTDNTGQFVQYDKGESAYNTDWNNFAPSIGLAWTLGGKAGLLGGLFGRNEADSVLRAGYTLGYNRPGTSDFTGNIDNNPGISQSASRNHTLGNLGEPGTILFRNRGDLGPPAFSTTRQYPMTDVITGDILAFDPNLQVPYSQTWTAGWQRKLTSDMAFEARYVGTRSLQSWQTCRRTSPPGAVRTSATRGRAPVRRPCRSSWRTSPGGPTSATWRRTATPTSPAARSSTSWRSTTPIRRGWPTRSTRRNRAARTRWPRGCRRTSSSPTRTTWAARTSSATAATRSTTRCSSSCASGSRPGSSSTPATCSARRIPHPATRCARRG
jgi:hypothetical protein